MKLDVPYVLLAKLVWLIATRTHATVSIAHGFLCFKNVPQMRRRRDARLAKFNLEVQRERSRCACVCVKSTIGYFPSVGKWVSFRERGFMCYLRVRMSG